jgi:DNA polymerase-3 subunit chi
MKIDFYILETTSQQQANLFACQLLEKYYAEQNLPILVHTNTKAEAERFDALLWTYRDDSFLPHQLQNAESNAPIQIGFGQAPSSPPSLLLNFSSQIPTFYQQCKQIIEIVFTDSNVQQLARQRYKQYRDAGYEINTIKN